MILPILPFLAFNANLWARVSEIFFGTIFSIALIWVVMQIWKKDEGGDADKGEKK